MRSRAMNSTMRHTTVRGRAGIASAAVLIAFPLTLACSRQTGVSVPAERLPFSATDLRAHVVELASDAYEGRGSGYPGEDKAEAYIEARFRSIGLHPAGDPSPAGRSYRQVFTFHPRGPELPGQILTSANVLGYYEGDDRRRRQEIVVLGAHHDGQGRTGQADGDRMPAAAPGAADDTVWNSADDNASSVAVLIEVARALMRDRVPHARSLVVATFGAEEHALNGSVRYVSDPPFPLDRHVAMLNLEKLGRAPEKEIIATATTTCACWDGILEHANAETGRHTRSLVPAVVADTDHYPFAALGVPAIVLGIAHEDDTHQPTDTSDKIDYEALASRAGYVREVLLDLLNRPEMPRFSGQHDHDLGLIVVAASESERRILGLKADAGALKVSGLLPTLPAERAGLVPGDFIVEVAGRTLAANADKETVQKAADKAATGLDLAVVHQGHRQLVSIPAEPAHTGGVTATTVRPPRPA